MQISEAFRLHPEDINLCMVSLAEPGAGKSPAFYHASHRPMRTHVDMKKNEDIIIDDFTEAGIILRNYTPA